MEKVIHSLIKEDQTGFIKGRNASDNMRRLLHILDFADSHPSPCVVFSLDAEKAFDRLEWNYIWAVLQCFGFGEHLISMIKTLYHSPLQTQVKKVRQRLYHLQQLRKFRVSPSILKTFYSGTIESVLTQCISVWYGTSSSQDCKALQRVVRLAERISGSALPSLQDIYLKRSRSRAVKIIKDSNHPG